MSGELRTIEELTEKRRAIWQKTHDKRRDMGYVEWAVRRVLSSKTEWRRLKQDPTLLIELALSVVDKKGREMPFFLNDVQRMFVDVLRDRMRKRAAGDVDTRPFFVLKGRQMGFTTVITAIQLCLCLLRRHFSGFTVADNQKNVEAIFGDKAKAMYESLPAILRSPTKYNNKQELHFERLMSTLRVGTAGENMGRSRTLHFVHYSEVAFYKVGLDSLQRSIGEALTADAIVVYETTANGYNSAKELWDSGACVNLFYPWWLNGEYRLGGALEWSLYDGWLTERLHYLLREGVPESACRWYAGKYLRYLDKASIRQEYPISAGEAFIASGECVFDRDALLAAYENAKPPVARGGYTYALACEGDGERMTDIRWVDDPTGPIEIVEWPHEEKGRGFTLQNTYVVGADSAGQGDDWFAIKVVDVRSGRTVATYHRRNVSEDEFAGALYCLGHAYFDAVVAVEVNFSYAPVRWLERWGYARIYRRDAPDSVGATSGKLGFLTSSVTRPLVVAGLVRLMREYPTVDSHKATVLELMSFVRGADGRAEASSGKHDDLVMALGIAHYVRGSMSAEPTRVETPSRWIENNFCVKRGRNEW